MCWIKDELKKLDKEISSEKENIILSIVYDDMIRNGKCTKNDYMKVIYGDGYTNKCVPLQNKASKILEITYNMVSGL